MRIEFRSLIEERLTWPVRAVPLGGGGHKGHFLPDNVRAARYRTNTGTWGIPQTIQAVNDDASDPQLAVDSRGNVIVLWSQNKSDGTSSGVIWSNRYRAHAGAWGRARIVQSQNGIARTPQVAITPIANTATAVWSQASDSGTYAIWAGSYR